MRNLKTSGVVYKLQTIARIWAPSKRVAFIDVYRGSLKHLAKELYKTGANPVMWMGYGGSASLDIIRKRYPACEIYDYWRFNKGASFFNDGLIHTPPVGLITSKDFLLMKDRSIKMMDRQDQTGRFRRQEREALFFSIFSFFYNKLVYLKPSLIVSAHSPHLPAPSIFFDTARLCGISAVHVREVAQAPLVYLATDYYNGFLRSSPSVDHSSDALSILSKTLVSVSNTHTEPHYMTKQRSTFVEPETLASERNAFTALSEAGNPLLPPRSGLSYRVNAVDFLSIGTERCGTPDQKKSRPSTEHFRQTVRALQYSEYSHHASKKLPKPPFAFFPLHYEPEKTSNPDGGEYYDTYVALLAARAFLPSDVALVVKEHITQFHSEYLGYVGRSPYFYRCFAGLPNIHFVDIQTDTRQLIQDSLLVISQTGTACLEAACLGKKALLLGDAWFSDLPNIYRLKSSGSFTDLMQKPFHSGQQVMDAALTWAKNYCIEGYVTGSFIRMHKNSYPDGPEISVSETCRRIAQTLRKNKLI